MLEDFEFRLRTRTDISSSEAILMNYLNSKNTLYPAKDMVMIALMSYWLPLAYQAVAPGSDLDLEPHIRSCIYRLKLHQQYLLELLGELPVVPKDETTIASRESSPKADLANTPTPEPLSFGVQIKEQNLSPTQSQTEWLNPFKASTK